MGFIKNTLKDVGLNGTVASFAEAALVGTGVLAVVNVVAGLFDGGPTNKPGARVEGGGGPLTRTIWDGSKFVSVPANYNSGISESSKYPPPPPPPATKAPIVSSGITSGSGKGFQIQTTALETYDASKIDMKDESSPSAALYSESRSKLVDALATGSATKLDPAKNNGWSNVVPTKTGAIYSDDKGNMTVYSTDTATDQTGTYSIAFDSMGNTIYKAKV